MRSQYQTKENHELSLREIEVAQLIAEWLKNEEVGKKLCISKATVKNHISRILKKINGARKSDIVIHYFQRNAASYKGERQ